MKILTKKKQKEALARMVANAIIAADALTDSVEKHEQGTYSIVDNLIEASYIVGGEEGARYAFDTVKEYVDILIERS